MEFRALLAYVMFVLVLLVGVAASIGTVLSKALAVAP